MKKKIMPFLLSIVFGFLALLSFPPFSIPFLKWLVLFPIFYYADNIKKSSIKKVIWISFLFAFSLCAFTFYWIIHLFVVYGGIPLWLSVIIFIPYSLLLNSKIFFIFFYLSYVQYKFKIFRKNKLIILPLIITFFDIFTPQVFNWYWGNMVTTNLIFSQIADIVGIHGLTFFYILFSYVLYRFLKFFFITTRGRYIFHFRIHEKFAWKLWFVFLVLFVIYIYGIYQYYHYQNISKDSEKIRVALIQPNAPLEKYGENIVSPQILENLMLNKIPSLMDLAFQKSENKLDLFVLPESAIPYYTTQKDFITTRFNLYHPYFEYFILRANAKYNTDTFFNEFGYRFSINENQERINTFNSSALISRRGIKEEIYHKIMLIAFGERIPFSDFLDATGLIEFIPESIRYNRFESGEKLTAIPYSNQNYTNPVEEKEFPLKLSEIDNEKEINNNFKDKNFKINGYFMPLICYEIIQPEFVRKFFNRASHPIDFIVNITQDKWYGKTIESYQHLELAKIRAIELRRAIVRSTNSGVSTAIDLNGSFLKPVVGNMLTKQEEEEIQIFDIPIFKDHSTIFSKIGFSWIYFLLGIWLILNIKELKKK